MNEAPRNNRLVEPWRFELTVWPQSPATPWYAEALAEGQVLPLCFEHPTEFLVYLTRLPGASPTTHGLR